MKKFLVIFLIALCFCNTVGCDDSYYTITYPEPVIVHPDNETAHTINGYRESKPVDSDFVSSSNKASSKSSSKSSSIHSSSSISSNFSNPVESYSSKTTSSEKVNLIYLGNRNTKKLHLNTCRHVKNMDENKLEVFLEYSEAIDAGYTPCKVCLKNN